MLLDVASMALGKSLDRWGDGWGPGRDSIQTSSSTVTQITKAFHAGSCGAGSLGGMPVLTERAALALRGVRGDFRASTL